MKNTLRRAFHFVKNIGLHPIHHDPFLLRLKSSIIGEGMLPNGNIEQMLYVVQNLPAEGVMLEIGSHAGLSAVVLDFLMLNHNQTRPFYTCDPWIYEGYNDLKSNTIEDFMDGRTDVSRADYADYIKNAFINSCRLFCKERLPFAVHATSDDFFSSWNEGATVTDIFNRNVALGKEKFAYCYIDGNHSYDFARRDAENCLKNMASGGFILLDDSGDHTRFGSKLVAQELQKLPNLELVSKKPNYLFKTKI